MKMNSTGAIHGVAPGSKFRVILLIVLIILIIAVIMVDKKEKKETNTASVIQSVANTQPNNIPDSTTFNTNIALETPTTTTNNTILEASTISSPTIPENTNTIGQNISTTTFPTDNTISVAQPVQTPQATQNTQQSSTLSVKPGTKIKEYILKSGDNPATICIKEYGSSKYTELLQEYNKNHGNPYSPKKLQIGSKIIIPPLEELSPNSSNKISNNISNVKKENTTKRPSSNQTTKVSEKTTTNKSYTVANREEPAIVKKDYLKYFKYEGKSVFYVVQKNDGIEKMFTILKILKNKNLQEIFFKRHPTLKENFELKEGEKLILPKAIVDELEEAKILANPNR